MSYLTVKIIKGHPYLYEVHSERDGDTVRQVFDAYWGRADGGRAAERRASFVSSGGVVTPEVDEAISQAVANIKPTPKAIAPTVPTSVPTIKPPELVAPKVATEPTKATTPTYYHATTSANAKKIGKGGYQAISGELSGKAGGMEPGVFLYPDDKEAAEIFGKNLKNPVVLESKVSGKVYDANKESKYGWEENLQITEIARDKKILDQLKADGYVGVTSVELGQPATFVFEPTAVSTVKPEAVTPEVKPSIPTETPKVEPTAVTPIEKETAPVATPIKTEITETKTVKPAVDFSSAKSIELAAQEYARSQGFTKKVVGDLAWQNPRNSNEFIRLKSGKDKTLTVYDSRTKSIVEVPTQESVPPPSAEIPKPTEAGKTLNWVGNIPSDRQTLINTWRKQLPANVDINLNTITLQEPTKGLSAAYDLSGRMTFWGTDKITPNNFFHEIAHAHTERLNKDYPKVLDEFADLIEGQKDSFATREVFATEFADWMHNPNKVTKSVREFFNNHYSTDRTEGLREK